MVIFCAGFFVFGFGAKAWANTYYVSTSGLDSNNGTSSSTPWAHHPWSFGATNTSLATVLNPDDVVYMKKGDTWFDCYITPKQSGTSGHNIITTSISSFGSGADPICSGSYDTTSWNTGWTNVSGNIWSRSSVTTQPAIALYNGALLTKNTATPTTPNLNEYGWSSNVLYVNIGSDPSSTTAWRVGKQSYPVYIGTKDYITFSHMRVDVANVYGAFYVNGRTGILFDRIEASNGARNGIYIQNCTDCMVVNSNIHDFVDGIVVEASNNTEIRNSTIYNIGTFSGVFDHAAIYQSGVILGLNIHDNIIYNVNGFGIRVYNDGIIINKNEIYNSGRKRSDGSLYTYNSGGAGGGGIVIEGTASSVIVSNNYVHDNYQGINVSTAGGTGGNMIKNNIVTNSTVNDMGDYDDDNPTNRNLFYNNTVYHNPSADNSPAYTGHGFHLQDVSGGGGKAAFANNTCYNAVASYASHCFFVTDNGNIDSIYLNNNILYSEYGGINARVFGSSYTNLSTYKAGIQGSAKVAGLDGIQANAENKTLFSNPLFTSFSDYHLQPTSPAIDAGISVGLTTDYDSNKIYGTPDIGGYEYQPPHTIGTNEIDIGAGARIYGDGKFRDVGTTNSLTADLKITPSGGTFSETTSPIPAFLDIAVSTWTNTGNHHKTWTESNAESTSLITDHTIGDLENNKNYNITVTDIDATTHITGINGTICNTVGSNRVCRSDNTGKIQFRYSGGYSTHTFDLIEGDNTAPETTASPTANTFNTNQTVTLSCNDNTGSGCDKTYYTLTGIDPTTGSTQYSGAITIPSNATTILKYFSTDLVGNSETIKSQTYIIDTNTPETTINSNPNILINTTSATFTFSASETATFQCKLASEAYTTCTTPKNYTNLAQGEHTFFVKAKDTANNEDATPAQYTFTVDSIAPTLTNLSPNNQTLPVETTSTNLTLTTNETATCKYATTQNTDYHSMLEFNSTNNINHEILITNLNSGQTYNYYIKCQDNAENISSEENLTFQIAPEEQKTSLNSIKIKIDRQINKFKDTIRINKNKFKLKQKDDSLANGEVKIYKNNSLWKTIQIDADGAWSKTLKLADDTTKTIKLKFYDTFGTLMGTKKAKVKVEAEKQKTKTIPAKLTSSRYQKTALSVVVNPYASLEKNDSSQETLNRQYDDNAKTENVSSDSNNQVQVETPKTTPANNFKWWNPLSWF